jgi:hypothetical protein
MGFWDLLGRLFAGAGGGGGSDRYRHKSGRYGRKGAYRKERNGDRVGRGKDGRYKK